MDFTVSGGAPQWAEAKVPIPGGWDQFFAYKPNASEYGKFMTAVARRYNGKFIPRGTEHCAAESALLDHLQRAELR